MGMNTFLIKYSDIQRALDAQMVIHEHCMGRYTYGNRNGHTEPKGAHTHRSAETLIVQAGQGRRPHYCLAKYSEVRIQFTLDKAANRRTSSDKNLQTGRLAYKNLRVTARHIKYETRQISWQVTIYTRDT